MNPQDLIGPSSALGSPAPLWFITIFKVAGFTLHMIPMNIWYAGMLLVALLGTFGKGNAKELAHRLSRSMPVIVAVGINLGIVPLLFTQVGYYQFYYPAGILIGWWWFCVIILLLFAYYGVYVYSMSIRFGKDSVLAKGAAWISSIAFIIIGFLFTNNFSLMVNINNWIKIFNHTTVGGATTGVGLNLSDPTLFPRWLMMFGMAIMTTAVYISVDALFFHRARTTRGYQIWAGNFTFVLFTIGMIWFGLMGSWYIFSSMDKYVIEQLHKSPLMYTVFTITALSPAVVWTALFFQRRAVVKGTTLFASISQILVLTLNAICRQWVQNTEIFKFKDLTEETVNIQWNPMILFLLLFTVGLLIVGWMISKIMSLERKPL
ncbi:MAG: hypothetical protein ACP5US_06995 [Candidatus Kryptoniota bacterium]